jgi:hypothetical protein
MIDQTAILTRACNAARMALAEWEVKHGLLTEHERQVFAEGFAAGMVHGARELRRIREEA